MLKTIVLVFFSSLVLLCSCATPKNLSAQAMPAEFNECTYQYIIPGESDALVMQEFKLKLSAPVPLLSLDSLVLIDGKVALLKQEELLWTGALRWNFKGEGQLERGDSATVYGHLAEKLVFKRIKLSEVEAVYLPAEAPAAN